MDIWETLVFSVTGKKMSSDCIYPTLSNCYINKFTSEVLSLNIKFFGGLMDAE